jgi:phosphomannomutase
VTKKEDFDSLIVKAEAWRDADFDDDDRGDLSSLIEQAKAQGPDEPAALELADRFSGLLQFGTAGLRGAMAAGPNRMNTAVVAKAAAGLGAFLKESLPGQAPKVVIGYDGRHNSKKFAEVSAAVLAAAGVVVWLMPRLLPTPLVAFATRKLNADAGIMVTASHNPAADNGYKVYLGGRIVTDSGQGAQLVSPFDKQISEKIAQVGPSNQIPGVMGVGSSVEEANGRLETTGVHILDDGIVQDYLASVLGNSDGLPRNIRIVTTSLHGVGGDTLAEMFRLAGFTDVHPVEEQRHPHPDFPTVAFPNPEEKGAIDLAVALAEKIHADLVIANDPDADRCAVAVVDPRAGGWRMLHGDEVGALLGLAVANSPAVRKDKENTVMANSIVSSTLLRRIAAKAGLTYSNTLTGFKWIARTPNLVFGYEEALGYCVDPANVRDKDGISAALVIAQLANKLKAEGKTVIDQFDELAREHGLFLTDQLSLRFTDLSQIPQTMAKLRANPPKELAGSPVVELADLSEGYQGLPPTDGILIRTQNDNRVIVRPSGTEPKVKCYLEVTHPVEMDATFDRVTEARNSARKVMDQIKSQMQAVLA